jgi:hypothetical protein
MTILEHYRQQKSPDSSRIKAFMTAIDNYRLEYGSPTWTRTRDTRINSPLLYRLSYWGTSFGEAV